ncbi:cell division protein FtsQ/DivIB [Sphingobacterium sp. Mn56C]|uniref:cell division protein FtsQ/DivIB n=1 Tax=Sphingobacterium sp. Mn56C TaxID=3395261 RepID=UPI003BBFA2E8
MRNIRWNLVLYTILGLLVFGGLVVLMGMISRKDKAQNCAGLTVMVEGKETFIDQQDISNMIHSKFGDLLHMPLKEVKLHAIELEIERLPYVSAAEVYADMDGKIQVKVQQREVLLRVINNNGKEYYVDAVGNKIPVTLKYVPHVLVASGHISEGYSKPLEKVESQLLKDLIKIVDRVKDDNLWGNQIVQLYVNEQKDIELIPRVGKELLVIGTADSLDYKLERLALYYTEIVPKVGAEAYQKVNVKYGGQIICERKGNWIMDSLQFKMSMKNN